MSMEKQLTAISGYLLLMIPGASAVHSNGLIDLYPGMDLTGTIVRVIAFLLGMSGAMYLAAVLWHKADEGSRSWKYLSISMIMFVFWNIIMTFGILLDVLHFGEMDHRILMSIETHKLIVFIINILDPVIEVIVFVLLLFGLRKITKAMRERPWTVFNRDEEENNE